MYFHHYLNWYFLLEIVFLMFIAYLSIDRLLDRYLCHLGWKQIRMTYCFMKKSWVKISTRVTCFEIHGIPGTVILLSYSWIGMSNSVPCWVWQQKASAMTSRRYQSQYCRTMVVFTMNQNESGRPVRDLLTNSYAHLHCSFKPSCLGLFQVDILVCGVCVHICLLFKPLS